VSQTLEAEATSTPAQASAAAPAIDVSVVVPIDNPDPDLEVLVRALGAELRTAGRTHEFVFVLDGVDGGLKDRILALRGPQTDVQLVSLARPFGYSVALSAGAEQARGAYLVTSPDYLQIDPVEIRRLVAALDGGADFVSPKRIRRVDPWLNRLQSRLFNALLRFIIRMPFHDLNCNFRAMRAQVLKDISIYGDLFRFLPVMAHRQGFRVVEVDVRHLKEKGRAGFFGVSVYVRRFLDILAVTFLTKFTHKPLRFFGIVGSIIALAGLLICLQLTYESFLPGRESLSNRPILILGAILIVLGVQFVGMGLIGEIIIFTMARNIREYNIERVDE
jgi:glycosyltransferase involved in cell wall biosynthesis